MNPPTRQAAIRSWTMSRSLSMESSHRGALPTWRSRAEPNVAEPPPAPVAPHLEQETEEYELEDESEEDDDVLESTPEFLQDAPDHDRLWFEQRPPRDFDFDG